MGCSSLSKHASPIEAVPLPASNAKPDPISSEPPAKKPQQQEAPRSDPPKLPAIEKKEEAMPAHNEEEKVGTDEERRRWKLVRDSWAFIAADLETNGINFFLRMFEVAPPSLQLFPFKDEPNLRENPILKGHARMVFRTIGRMVENLHDLSEVLPELWAVGKAHAQYHVTPRMFGLVGECLFFALQRGCGESWTPEVLSAWQTTYDRLADELSAGMAEPVPTSSTNAAPNKEADATARKHTLVRESWAIISQNIEHHGVRFFINFFRVAPPALQLFPFKAHALTCWVCRKRTNDMKHRADDPNLEDNAILKGHARMVFRTIGRMVGSLEDLSAVLPELWAVGKAHGKFNVTPRLFSIVGDSLMETLKEGCGDVWTDEVQVAWRATYDRLAEELLKGMQT